MNWIPQFEIIGLLTWKRCNLATANAHFGDPVGYFESVSPSDFGTLFAGICL
jgi:hypothetical protein